MENNEKNTKLVINLRDGIVHVEGDELFVRDVYNDFKERVSKPILVEQSSLAPQLEQRNLAEEDLEAPSPRLRGKSRRKAATISGTKGEVANYKPTFNSALDLSGLASYYRQYEPANHPEKILIFATYLRDVVKVQSITANDVFTCYQEMRSVTKTPEAFLQAFRDTQNKTHYIDYISPTNIQITIAGNNYFNMKLKRKGVAEE